MFQKLISIENFLHIVSIENEKRNRLALSKILKFYFFGGKFEFSKITFSPLLNCAPFVNADQLKLASVCKILSWRRAFEWKKVGLRNSTGCRDTARQIRCPKQQNFNQKNLMSATIHANHLGETGQSGYHSKPQSVLFPTIYRMTRFTHLEARHTN